MKRTFLILLLIFMAMYGKLGYELFNGQTVLESATTGLLSDIAKEVTAIPLKTFGKATVPNVRNVQQEGANLFLISDDILYRFHRSGELIAPVTDPQLIAVAGYLIDPVRRCLVVMGNEDEVHFYSFDGNLLDAKKISESGGHKRIHTAALYDNRIWTAEECLRLDPDTHTCCIEKQVVEYDSSFQKIKTHAITSAQLYNGSNIHSSCHFELAVSEHTGELYAYTPSIDPDNLLRDTLLIKQRQILHADKPGTRGITAYPLRFGTRYWISSYEDPGHSGLYRTFCFDRDSGQSWHIKEGFKDNFYHTGDISRLHPSDMYGNLYYFCKSGEETKSNALNKSEPGNAVVFMVKLKA